MHTFEPEKEGETIFKTNLQSGEAVVISTDREIALAQGVLSALTERSVTLLLDKDLHSHSAREKVIDSS